MAMILLKGLALAGDSQDLALHPPVARPFLVPRLILQRPLPSPLERKVSFPSSQAEAL